MTPAATPPSRWRSRCAPARTAAPPSPPAPRPASSRPPSCATAATPTAARASRKAVGNVNGEIAEAVAGHDATDQQGLDAKLIELDGTDNKSRLGANAILGVSLAAARAAAAEENLPLWRYLGGDAAHDPAGADDERRSTAARTRTTTVDFQEFMVVPVGAPSFARGAAHGRRGLPRAQGDAEEARPEHRGRRRGRLRARPGVQRGGAAGADRGHRGRRLHARRRRRDRARPGRVSEIFKNGAYELEQARTARSRASELAAYWTDLAARYPILSIEDGMDEEDWDGWKALTDSIGDKVQLVGDDLFVTNVKRLQRGIDTGTANSILIKVNQIGTLTETLAAIDLARSNGYTAVMSPPLGRDRGHDDRRPRRRHRLRPDQDRRAVALGSRGQVQPAAAHRGGARRRRRRTRAGASSAADRSRTVRCRGREPGASNERGRYGRPYPRDPLGSPWALGADRRLRARALPLHRARR